MRSWIFICALCWFGELFAQHPMRDYLYLYQPKTGRQEFVRPGKNLVICLKESKVNDQNSPKAITQDKRIYVLKYTGQRGDVLMFNDSLAIKYTDMAYLIFSNKKNAFRILTGSMVMLTTMVAIITNETAGVAVGIFGLPISIYCFANVKKEKMYTKDWLLEIQNSPELLYPGKESKEFSYWPTLIERYQETGIDSGK